MLDLIRESPLSQTIHLISGNKFLQYPEERPDYQLPIQYALQLEKSEKLVKHDHDSPNFNDGIPVKTENDSPFRIASHQKAGDDLENLMLVMTTNSVRTAPYSAE
jgi:MFS transporter, DHA1 family, multidrug resistance protein